MFTILQQVTMFLFLFINFFSVDLLHHAVKQVVKFVDGKCKYFSGGDVCL